METLQRACGPGGDDRVSLTRGGSRGRSEQSLAGTQSLGYGASRFITVKLLHFLFPRRLHWFVRTRSGGRINLMDGIIMTGKLGLNYDGRLVVGENHFDRMFAITLGYQVGY